MKRLLIIFFIVLSTFASANAQYINKNSYKDLKGIYNPKEYVKHRMPTRTMPVGTNVRLSLSPVLANFYPVKFGAALHSSAVKPY